MTSTRKSQASAVRPKKHLGQHFLRDLTVADRIAESVDTAAEIPLLEVGPGTGALTRPLIDKGRRTLEVVEIDRDSVAFLREQVWFQDAGVVLHEGDMLKWKSAEWAEVAGGGKFSIVGNFPYNISSQILFRALDQGDRIVELTGMFQKEVAERVCAPSGNKVYGILSVLMQTYFDCSYLFTVDEGAFDPPPKVKSGVIRCVRKPADQIHSSPTPAHLALVVKAAFNLRRKTLRNALRAANLDFSAVDETTLGLRAEALTVEGFLDLARKIPDQRSTTKRNA
jgi:16S rRNA (adenine1518-N6/adenine1519-N6)-dimethyltransferase